MQQRLAGSLEERDFGIEPLMVREMSFSREWPHVVYGRS